MKKVDLHSNNKPGFSSVEVLLAIALFSMVVLSLSGALVFSVQGNADANLQSKAVFLAEEALEATRLIRGNSLTNLSDGDYGLAIAGSTWTFSGTTDTIDEYTRQVSVSTVNASTKLVEATVDWSSSLGQARTVTLSMYLTDWQLEGEEEEEPPPPVIGDWTMPSITYSHDVAGSSNGESLFLDSSTNTLYAATLFGNPDFISYDVTTPTSPTELDGIDVPDGINRVFINAGYAFIATRGSASEFVTYDVSDPADITHVYTLDVSGAFSANSIVMGANNNQFYLVRQFDSTGHELISIDSTNKASPTVTDSVNTVSGHAYAVDFLPGSPAHVIMGTSSWSADIQVVDTTNPMAVVESVNIEDQLSCRAVHVYAANRAAVGCGTGAVYLLDVTDPTNVSIVGTHDLGTGSIFRIQSGNDGDYLFVVGAVTDKEFAVLDISDEGSIAELSSIDFNAEVNDVVYDSANDIVYFSSDLDSAEWGVIEPG
jgi:Tfp pilus assembly protein PilV